MARGDDQTPAAAEDRIHPTTFKPPGRLHGVEWPRVPWTQLFVGGTLLSVGVVMLLIFGARSVRLMVTPNSAAVTVAHGLAPHFDGSWMLLPGTHQVAARAPGYRPLQDQIKVSGEATQTFQFELKPLPGQLRLVLAPVARAEVRIDDQPAGYAPGLIENVEAGTRQVVVRAARYLDFSADLNVEGKGQEQALSVTLQPAWAKFTVASRPDGATVRSGANILGVTPLVAELIHGEREIAVTKKGYKPWHRRVTVIAGQPVNIPDVRLVKDDGYLKVVSAPAGAAVTVDGNFKGEAPLKFAVSADNEHEVAIMKTGYVPGKIKVSVESGDLRELPIQLAPELAVIELVTTPEDAELLLDGAPHGTATQRLELPTFEHEVIVRKPGFATYRTLVTPRKGVEKRLQIRLKTAAEMAQEEATRAPPLAASATRPSPSNNEAQQQAELTASVFVPPELANGPKPQFTDGRVRSVLGQELKLFAGGEFQVAATTPHAVHLARPFYMGLLEVSNRDYRHFISSHRTRGAPGQDLNADNLPVANVTWEAAATYCNWLSRRESLPAFYQIKYGRVLGVNPDAVGYRLPTEAEWDWVARLTPDGKTLEFPWSGGFPPRTRSGNYADESAKAVVKQIVVGYNDSFAASAPVGSFPPNLRGLYDLAGNVSEWVHDFDGPASSGAVTDPLGPSSGASHVIKGSSWAQGSSAELNLKFRAAGNQPRPDLGFRLARYAQ